MSDSSGRTEEAAAKAAALQTAVEEWMAVAPSLGEALSLLGSLWGSAANAIECPHCRKAAFAQIIAFTSNHLAEIIDAEHTDDAGVTKH